MVAPRPIGTRTRFATDDEYSSGAFTGSPNKVDPLSGENAEGWHPHDRPPAQKFNKLFNESSHWLDYIADLPLMNFGLPVFLDTAGAAIDTTYERVPNGGANQNQVADIFYSPSHDRWVLTGSNTAGKIYIVDQGLVGAITTGVGSAPKFAFGCEVADRALYVTGDTRSAAQSITLVRTGSGSLTGGTLVTLPGVVASFAYAGKAISIEAILASGALICGGRDGNHKVWYSSDTGATFTEQNVGAATNSASLLDRVLLGKIHTGSTERLIAFTSDTSGNGGDKLWYSDGGPATTWSSVTLSAYSAFLDMVYLPDCEKYVAVANSGKKLLISDDPVADTWTELVSYSAGTYPRITAFNAFGEGIVYATAFSADIHVVAAIGSPGQDPKLVLRPWDAASNGLIDKLVGCIGVNTLGQFAYQCQEGPIGISLRTYSL